MGVGNVAVLHKPECVAGESGQFNASSVHKQLEASEELAGVRPLFIT
jgi:hypothetical protein